MSDSKKAKQQDPKTDEPKSDDLAQKVAEAEKAEILKQVQDDKKVAGMTDKQEIPAEVGTSDNQEIPASAGMKRIEELTNHLARCMADLQNYKRRSEEDKGRFVKFANAELLKVLLPALENLDRSCKHLPDTLKEDAWAQGVLHTQADLTKALANLGVKRIETVGQKLDLNFHEVLMQGPGEKEVIVEELDPGYTLNGELLKAAKVKVGDGSK